MMGTLPQPRGHGKVTQGPAAAHKEKGGEVGDEDDEDDEDDAGNGDDDEDDDEDGDDEEDDKEDDEEEDEEEDEEDDEDEAPPRHPPQRHSPSGAAARPAQPRWNQPPVPQASPSQPMSVSPVLMPQGQ